MNLCSIMETWGATNFQIYSHKKEAVCQLVFKNIREVNLRRPVYFFFLFDLIYLAKRLFGFLSLKPVGPTETSQIRRDFYRFIN
jgi:hypothetical protein